MLKYSHVTAFVWDIHFTIPTFDFYFKFKIPEPNKDRLITERDESGRIITQVLKTSKQFNLLFSSKKIEFV